MESFRLEADKNIEGLVWHENGRRYSLEMRKNEHGRFLLCLVTDLDGKRHILLFPEGNGLINGWTMLEKALQALGHEEDIGDRGKEGKTYSSGKEDKQKGRAVSDIPMKLMSPRRRRHKTIWVDKFEYSPKGDLGLLKYGVVGS